MPDRDVETIRDLIFYQYAKIMARSAFAIATRAETLDSGDLDRDGELTVLDVDFIVRRL